MYLRVRLIQLPGRVVPTPDLLPAVQVIDVRGHGVWDGAVLLTHRLMSDKLSGDGGAILLLGWAAWQLMPGKSRVSISPLSPSESGSPD